MHKSTRKHTEKIAACNAKVNTELENIATYGCIERGSIIKHVTVT